MDIALLGCVHMIHNEQPQLFSDHDRASRQSEVQAYRGTWVLKEHVFNLAKHII